MKHNIFLILAFIAIAGFSILMGRAQGEVEVLEEKKRCIEKQRVLMDNNKAFNCGMGYGIFQTCVDLSKTEETKLKCEQLYEKFVILNSCFKPVEKKEEESKEILL